MPKVSYSNTKGMFQETGSGTSGLASGGDGLSGVALGASTSVVGTAANYDITITQPAGTVLTDVGIVATTATDVNDTIVVSFGTAAGGQQIAAQANMTAAEKAVVGSAQSTVHTCEDGAALLAFATSAPVYSAAARTIHCRATTTATQGTGVLRPFATFIKI